MPSCPIPTGAHERFASVENDRTRRAEYVRTAGLAEAAGQSARPTEKWGRNRWSSARVCPSGDKARSWRPSWPVTRGVSGVVSEARLTMLSLADVRQPTAIMGIDQPAITRFGLLVEARALQKTREPQDLADADLLAVWRKDDPWARAGCAKGTRRDQGLGVEVAKLQRVGLGRFGDCVGGRVLIMTAR